MANVYIVYDKAADEIVGVFSNMPAARRTVANFLAHDLAEDSPLWRNVTNGEISVQDALEVLASAKGPQYYEHFDVEIQTFEVRESPSSWKK